MSTPTFGTLGVPAPLVDVLAAGGITIPTPIQASTLPDSLAGRDVLGRGRTGSGKTVAFVLPLLARLAASGTTRQARRPRALILAPTRELVAQIEEAMTPLAARLGLTSRTVFGGVGQGPQVSAIRRGVDVVVACPGRLEDLIGQGHVSLDAVEVTVIDEADHMADLGFLPQVRRLLDATPRRGQRMLFSATLDAGIGVIADRYLTNPVTHEADSAQSPGRHDGAPRAARDRRRPPPGAPRPRRRPRPHRRVHPHQAPRQEARAPAQRLRRARGRAARQPQPERPHAHHGRLPLRRGPHPRRHRHRRARHPRRRRRPRHPRRPAGRAQGLHSTARVARPAPAPPARSSR